MQPMRIGSETTAIVTGASAGIGRALAVELAARGATVGLLARRRERLDELAAELPGEHLVLAADVAKRRQTRAAIDRFAKRAGGPDLLFANAGIAHYGPFADAEIELAEEMIDVNVRGTMYSVAAALPHMLDRAAGHIVVTSSGAGIRAFPWGAVYGATKAFDRGFAEALRHELSGTGVSVTTVFPGEVETDLHDHQPGSIPDWRRGNRALPAAEVARAMIAAVEADEANLCLPAATRLLTLNGLAPRTTDKLLRRIRGATAAPRRD
jgi:NADP-dependent 3-hydroxy acid dehydrogenase YdfG